jgi:peptidase M23-like protein
MRCRRLSIVLVSLALCLLASVAAFAARGGSQAALGADYVQGPAVITDELNGVSADLPAGWYAAVPTAGLFGTTTFANYDMGHAEDWLPAHSAHVLLARMAKVDVMALPLGARETLAQWVERRLTQGEMDGGQVAAGTRIPYQIAGLRGLAYVSRLGLASKVEIALRWAPGQVLLASIAPLDTAHLDAALAVIDSVRKTGEPSRAAVAKAARERLAAPLRSLIQGELAAAGSLDKMQNVTAAASACTSWAGSDNGNCATGMSCAPNTSITLFLPFFFQTWWQSGGAGSFFGNFFHGNCNLDYYAVDFNQYSSSSCSSSLNDTGQRVYAAANGTATVGFDSGGYGNFVLVAHSNGYKSRYAHLQSVNVTNNQAVTTQTIVGFVGDTGSAAGAPHLHFGYQTGGVSFCNRAGGCPNGEAARSPQTQKPSPMQTNLGSRNIVDFGCYQAPP